MLPRGSSSTLPPATGAGRGCRRSRHRRRTRRDRQGRCARRHPRGDVLLSWQRPVVAATRRVPPETSWFSLRPLTHRNRAGPRGIVLLAGSAKVADASSRSRPEPGTENAALAFPTSLWRHTSRENGDPRRSRGAGNRRWRSAAERRRTDDGGRRLVGIPNRRSSFRAGNSGTPETRAKPRSARRRTATGGHAEPARVLRGRALRIGLPARAEAQYREGLDVAAAAAPEGLVVAFLIERLERSRNRSRT